jgi:hypothetical protein
VVRRGLSVGLDGCGLLLGVMVGVSSPLERLWWRWGLVVVCLYRWWGVGVVGCVRAVGVEWWWWWVLRVLSRVVMALPDGGCVCVSGVGCLVP